MNSPDLLPDIAQDDIQLMRQLGISGAYISHALRKNGASPTDDLPASPRHTSHPLSDTEIDILRSGGAKGLDDTPETRFNLLKGLHDLLRECRLIVENFYDIEAVSSLLRITAAEIEHKVHRIPPELHSFEIEAASLRFPGWQLTDSVIIPYLTELLNAAGTNNTFILSRFMLMPNTELEIETEHLCPREWLVRALDPDVVLSAARELKHD